MSTPLIIACGLIYVWVALEQAAEGNIGMAITFGAYALANVGLCIAARQA